MPGRPSAALRIAALGLPPSASAVPAAFIEDADFHAMRGPGIDAAPQSFAEFCADENRNQASASRRTIVVVPMGYSESALALAPHGGVLLPSPSAVAAYLTAFTGLASRVAPEMRIVPWTSGGSTAGRAIARVGGRRRTSSDASSTLPRFCAVETSVSSIRVRMRRDPDREFSRQLEVSDLLDALVEDMAADAYTMLGLTPFDIHESGALLGGRAYVGSRIAVISLARYHPDLADVVEDWPLGVPASRGGAALRAARAAAAAVPLSVTRTPAARAGLWLARVAGVASHELGHCLGLDHCIYYACFMGENEGQPPYACPVCLRKLLTTVRVSNKSAAAGGGGGGGGTAATVSSGSPDAVSTVRARYIAVRDYCADASRSHVRLWAAFCAWLDVKVGALPDVDE